MKHLYFITSTKNGEYKYEYYLAFTKKEAIGNFEKENPDRELKNIKTLHQSKSNEEMIEKYTK